MTSLQGKMFLSFGLAITLAIVTIAYSTYYSASKVIERNAISYISDRIQGANANLQSMVEEADQVSKVIAANEELIRRSLVSDVSAPSYDWFLEKKSVEDFLSSMSAYKGYVQKISVGGRDGRLFQTRGLRSGPERIASLMQLPGLDENRKQLLYDPEGNGKLMLIRPILDDGELIGLCVVDFDPTIIQQAYGIEPLAGSIVTVIDGEGKVIYHSGNDTVGRPVEETALAAIAEEIPPDRPSSRMIELDGEAHLSVQSVSSYTGWQTIGMVPVRSLLQEVRDIRFRILSLTAVVLVAVLVISIVLSNQITKNIKRLRNAMRLVREGHMGARPRIRTKDEVGQLSAMFVSMMERVQHLLSEVKSRERQRREAEYRALQAQINPHFLYNTLNTIKYLAEIQFSRNIAEISESLIELLRYAIDPKKEMVSIREELEQMHRFVNIQKYKYLDRVKVTVDAEEETLDAKIPKLILQPIVENALYHGFGTTTEEGTIAIRVYGDRENRVNVSVMDDGIGMTRERIAQVLSVDGESDAGRTGIGLRNINERLRHAFGESHGVEIISEPGRFTAVEFAIPRTKEANGA